MLETIKNLFKKQSTELVKGQYYKVKVISETFYGYFVQYENIVGLIHKSKISKDTEQRTLRIGETVKAMLIEIKEKKGRLLYSFSLIHKESDYLKVSKTLQQGDIRFAIIRKREKIRMSILLEQENINASVKDNRFKNLYKRKFKDGQRIKVVFKHYDMRLDKLYFGLEGWKPV